MKCPFCGSSKTKVVDTRHDAQGNVRRRRECTDCDQRFSTVERAILTNPLVVKRDGRRDSFDREKLLNGLLRACEKRPVPRRDLVAIVDAVESELASRDVREMSTEEIGNRVIEELRRLDQVAYVRFASVYRRFEDVSQFMDELKSLLLQRDD